MRLPDLPALAQRLHEAEDGAEELLEVREALHDERLASERLVPILAPDDPLGEEIDERVGLGIHVVTIEHDLRVVEHLPQPPYQGVRVPSQGLVPAEGVEVDAVRLEGCVVVHVGERLRPEAESGVLPAVLLAQEGGLIEKAEVGAFHVEAERRDAALVAGEGLEDAAQQEFHRAGLRGETRDPRDVEVRGLGAEQEVAVQVDGGLQAPGRVESDRDAGGALAGGIRIHPKREHHVLVAREPDGAERHRLERLFGDLPQHGGREQANLRPLARLQARGDRIAVGADHGLHRGR